MSMVTQCPHCSTAFNVTPEQLFARDGRVRCGSCRQVFDGLVNLTSLEALEAGVPPPLADTSEAELRAQAEALTAGERIAPSHGFAPLNWPMVPEVPVVPVPQITFRSETADVPGEGASQVDTGSAQTLAGDSASPAVADVPAQVAAGDGEDEKSPQRPSRAARWLWGVAATLAALALGAQLLYGFRSELAAYVPRLRPALVQMCGWARCSVPPLQRPSSLAIQASDLLILDKAKPHLVQLIVTLQNQSGVEVGYPAIDLALNDRFDHAVARRVFLPKDYLRGSDAGKTVIAGSVTTTVRIDLDLSELSAGGFGLQLIPVPQT